MRVVAYHRWLHRHQGRHDRGGCEGQIQRFNAQYMFTQRQGIRVDCSTVLHDDKLVLT